MKKVFIIFMMLLMSTISVASAETASVSSGKVFFQCTDGYRMEGMGKSMALINCKFDVYDYEEVYIREINLPVLKIIDPATNRLIDTVSNIKLRDNWITADKRESMKKGLYSWGLTIPELEDKVYLYPEVFNVVIEGDVTMEYEEYHENNSNT